MGLYCAPTANMLVSNTVKHSIYKYNKANARKINLAAIHECH
jgi:hypothetical protein